MHEDAVFNRPRRRPIAMAAIRIGINRKINSGTLTADQAATLSQALDNGDVLEVIQQHAGDAGIQDPMATQARDWSGFFSALGDFLVKIMPLILQLLQAFGGGGLIPTPKPAAVDSVDTIGGQSRDPRIQAAMLAFPTIPPIFWTMLASLGAAELKALLAWIKEQVGQT